MTRVSNAGREAARVINYNLGQDPVRALVEAPGGTAGGSDRRWREVLALLLQSPRLRSELR